MYCKNGAILLYSIAGCATPAGTIRINWRQDVRWNEVAARIPMQSMNKIRRMREEGRDFPLLRGAALFLATCLVRAGLIALLPLSSPGAEYAPPLVFVGDKDYPPIAYLDDGVAKGMDVDLAKALAEAMKREPRVELMDWNLAQEKVLNGGADVLLGLSISDERRKLYDFSDPTFTREFVIVVRSGEMVIRSVDDLNTKNVGMTPAGFPRKFLKGQTGIHTVLIDNYRDGLARLLAGKVDALAADRWVVAYLIEKGGLHGVTIVGKPFATAQSAIAVRKGNAPLLDEINRALQALEAAGKIAAIQDSWHPQEILFISREQMRNAITAAAVFFLVTVLGGMGVWIVTLKRQVRDRRKAESATRESETRLRTLADASFEGIGVCRDGITVDINDQMLKMFGYTRQEVLGMPIIDFVAPESRELVRQMIEYTEPYEHLAIHKDGTLFPVEVCHRIMARKPHLMRFTAVRDLTRRKRTEAELIWKTAFLEAQLDSALDAILVVDDRTKRIFQNQRLLKLFNVPDDIARDNEDASLLQYVTDQVKNPKQFIERVAYLYANPGETGRDEIELADGRIMDRYSAPVRDKAGKYYGRIWTFRDITAQRKLEEQVRQSQKMEAIGQLASGVAHDFNNILAVISMQAGLLGSEKGASQEQSELVGEIESAIQRAANLTRQLLLFSRKQTMQLCDVDLNDIVLNITRMLQRVLGEDIQMQFKYEPRPLFIRGDAGMIDQVLMNLTLNARDAMPKGGHLFIETSCVDFDELEAAQSPQSRPGSFTCLSVSDTGIGIPPEILPEIFNPFFSTKDIGKGTGLGLATVFGIVQQHQGWIDVYSKVGHGTAFRVYIPWIAGEAGQKTVEKKLVSVRGGQETILLVEDDLSLRISTQKMLQKLGYHVLEAYTGFSALEVWKHKRNEIDLLLTDLMMPDGMTGKELSQRLLQEKPTLKVIYISGYSAEIAARDFPLEEGVNFLAKPFEMEKLARIIRNSLDSGPASKV